MRAINIDQSITLRNEDSFHRYLNELERTELISVDEEILLAQKIRAGDEAALDRLVKANLRFVVSCAKKYQNLGLSLSDLVSEGNLGLIKAARLFDETKGFKFISFAVWWIRQSIMSALGRDTRMIRLPMNIVQATSNIRKKSDELEQHLERAPIAYEITGAMGLEDDHIAMDYAFGRIVVSLDNTINEDSTMSLWEIMADKNAEATDHGLMNESVNGEVKRLLNALTPRDRAVLIGFYGLSGRVKGFDEIAEELGLSTERVRQLKLGAIQKLQHLLTKGNVVKMKAQCLF